MILTDEEIESIKDATMYEGPDSFEYDYDGIISKVQAAVIAKLAAGVSVEPIAWTYKQNLSSSNPKAIWCRKILLYAGNNNATGRDRYGVNLFTLDQLQTAIAAARVKALEDAYKVVENLEPKAGDEGDPFEEAVMYALAEIHALKGGV